MFCLFKYVGSGLTGDENYDTEMGRRIDVAQDAFHNLRKVLRKKKKLLEKKNRLRIFYIILVILDSSQFWMNETLKATKIWFSRKILAIIWFEHMSSNGEN